METEQAKPEKNWFLTDVGVIMAETFSSIYPVVNEVLMGLESQDSRDGGTREMLDVKTILTNPYKRLVGGCKRNINPFFLLAEALWIFAGRKDVEFLTIFNSRMANFSDDGKVFHAPYGYRLRHWGVATESHFVEENMHSAQGIDQVADAIRILAENPNSRQVVMSIWNPDLDLGAKTKDVPCNDLVMLKIRGGKLITTIQNRSNDLHWGLPTNIFQFSFLTELMAGCLGIKLGTQTHNSQSLHIYDWSKEAIRMNEALHSDDAREEDELYSISNPIPMDLNFTLNVPVNRLRELDYYVNIIIDSIMVRRITGEQIKELHNFSEYLYRVYLLLTYYNSFKHGKTSSTPELCRVHFLEAVKNCGWTGWDVWELCMNFVHNLNKKEQGYYGKL